MLSFKISQIFKNTFFCRTIPVAASSFPKFLKTSSLKKICKRLLLRTTLQGFTKLIIMFSSDFRDGIIFCIRTYKLLRAHASIINFVADFQYILTQISDSILPKHRLRGTDPIKCDERLAITCYY